jgi:Flp pilus assembly protein TadD
MIFILTVTFFTLSVRRTFGDTATQKNNSGFVLLHSGLYTEADKVLSSAILDGQFNQIVLSNYALCKAALGDFDKAKALINAAQFRERPGHSKAVFF